MQVKEMMTDTVALIGPSALLVEAARRMREEGVGVLPVGEGDRLIGMITDRDIMARAIAEGMDPTATTVKSVMSDKVLYCYEDQTGEEVAENMAKNQIHRLPVLDRDKRLVGIISLSDISAGTTSATSAETAKETSKVR